MKAIQITVDESLLARLDADEEVQQRGRSAVLRDAVDAYLRQRRKRRVGEAYRKAYGGKRSPARELAGWTSEAD